MTELEQRYASFCERGFLDIIYDTIKMVSLEKPNPIRTMNVLQELLKIKV